MMDSLFAVLVDWPLYQFYNARSIFFLLVYVGINDGRQCRRRVCISLLLLLMMLMMMLMMMMMIGEGDRWKQWWMMMTMMTIMMMI